MADGSTPRETITGRPVFWLLSAGLTAQKLAWTIPLDLFLHEVERVAQGAGFMAKSCGEIASAARASLPVPLPVRP